MKCLNKFKGYVLVVPILLFLFSHCEYQGPASPWEETQKKAKTLAEITAIEPAEASAASEITIIGKNFSPIPEEDAVYFDNVQCVIKSVTDTSIVVYRPNIIGDSLIIKVAIQNAINIAKFSPYKLEAVVEDYGRFADTEAILAAALDRDENVYLALGSMDVIRIKADGVRDANYLGTTSTSLWTDMKIGSDGYLYMARGNNIVYRMPPGGGAVETYVTFPGRNTDRVKSIDFDQNGNLFCGGKKSGLMVVRPDQTTKKLGIYGDYDIITIRIYSGYVYVTALYSGSGTATVNTGIWRHAINQDGSVGSQELVLDYGASPYANVSLNDMTFSEQGTIYLGITHPETPIVTYNPNDGSYKALFVNLISSPVDQLVWGNSTHLYAIINRNISFSKGGKLIKVNTGELGAPYYGR